MLRAYRIPFSTNVERIALACGHKGLAVEWVDVDPRDRSPVRELSGQDLVPVLVDGDRVIHDSLPILRQLEARFPEPPLFPRQPARRAELDVFLDWFDGVWKRPPNEIEAERRKAAPDEGRVGELGAMLERSLDRFEALLDGREYLWSEFSAADCAAFPFVKYAIDRNAEDDEPFHAILREFLPLRSSHPGVEAWIRRVDARPRA